MSRVNSRAIWWLLILLSIGLLSFAAYGLWDWSNTTRGPEPVIAEDTITHSTDRPDETQPTQACADYRVPPSQPRQIEIPDLQVSGCIQKVGIDQHNAIAVPPNIHLAGWYTDSVLPGEPGVSVVVGHVLGRYNDAIFAQLSTLSVGDVFRIQFGDMSWKEFEVLSTDDYSVEQTATEQFRQLDDVERQLTLVTCGGTWLPDEETYDRRVVVRSEAR